MNDEAELIPTRQSLLSRLKDWTDQDSWKAFFDIYGKLIYGRALKSGLTPTEAEDVLQETILSVAKKMPEFKYDTKNGSFKGWLFTLTNWRITDQFRKRQRTQGNIETSTCGNQTCEIEDFADPSKAELEKGWDAEWESNLLNAALQKLKRWVDPQHFQIFDLYVVKQWPVIKVAKSLGISAARVYLVKHRIGSLVKKEIALLEDKLI
jgi:RNA polymerase sigma-70 factor (ECF subfamily)